MGALVINFSLWKRNFRLKYTFSFRKFFFSFLRILFQQKTFGGYNGKGNDFNLREPIEKKLGVSAEKSQE